MNTRDRIAATIWANNKPATRAQYLKALAEAPRHWTGAKWETHAEHMARIGAPLPLGPVTD